MVNSIKELEERLDAAVGMIRAEIAQVVDRPSLDSLVPLDRPEAPGRQWILGIGASIGGVVLGAVLQPLFSEYIRSPDPTIESVDIDLAVTDPVSGLLADLQLSASGKDIQKIDVPGLIVESSSKCKWTSAFEAQMPRAAYVAKLQSDREKLDDILRDWARLEADLKAWPAQIRRGNLQDAQAVLRILINNQSLVLAHMFGEARRGTSIFSGDANVDLSPVLDLKVDRDGDFYVSLKGSKQVLAIVWSTSTKFGQHKDELSKMAKRLADAVAYCIQGDLNQVRDCFDTLRSQVDDVRALRGLLQEQVDQYSHWMITVVVHNQGREPVSIGTSAALYVHTRGKQLVGGDGVRRAMVADTRIDLVRVENQTIETQGIKLPMGVLPAMDPVVVMGGGSAAIKFQSKLPNEQGDDWRGVQAVFKSDGAQCRLQLPTLGDMRCSVLASSEMVFSVRQSRIEWPAADTIWKGQ